MINRKQLYRDLPQEVKDRMNWNKGKKRLGTLSHFCYEVLKKQNFKCNICHINEWNNKPLKLALHHKDGNNQNNIEVNLEYLCPNCHTQTQNYAGKNNVDERRVGHKFGAKVTDEQIIELIPKCKTIRQLLIQLNLSPRGGNYSRVKRLMDMYFDLKK